MIRTLCYSASSLLALALLVGTATEAQAQPGAPPPPPPPHAGPPAVVYQAAPPMPRWGIGLHLGGLGVTSERDRDDARETEMGVIGLQLRYRLHRRWELEADLSYMEGELPGLENTRRSTGAFILGGMFHINPDSRWLWSVMVGVGVAHDRIWYEKGGDRYTQAEFAEGVARLGVGLERRFGRFGNFGIAAQLYAIGMARNEEELDGPAYEGRDGPVPEESSGGLFQIVGNYYF
jgi:hypothetical protein